TIRRWRAKGWKPPAPAKIEILPPDQPIATRGHALANLLVTVAIGIGILALAINGQTGWHYGVTPLAAMTFAAMAVAGNTLAIFLPSAASHLWHSRHAVLAIAAWVVWCAAAGLALFAALGFVERNVSDTAAGRRAVVSMASASTDQRTAA